LAAAAAAAATSAPPEPAQVLGPVAIPHGAAREDVSVVAPDPAIVSGKRWAAEVHRIGQSTAAPAGGVQTGGGGTSAPNGSFGLALGGGLILTALGTGAFAARKATNHI